ncbi:hypothetical protein [Klebsiella pneumoniae]|uniref:hypothetical protein n=1 Tax=Klebsiella pneumoniae TaxID=573 RepID=UPI0018884DC8|nr:hypothetical protein [Klebsiella pneumoniae]
MLLQQHFEVEQHAGAAQRRGTGPTVKRIATSRATCVTGSPCRYFNFRFDIANDLPSRPSIRCDILVQHRNVSFFDAFLNRFDIPEPFLRQYRRFYNRKIASLTFSMPFE